MKLDAVKDAKSFVVLEISKTSNTDEFKIKILVDQEELDFVVTFFDEPSGISGVKLPERLEHLTLEYLYCVRDFLNLLFAVCKEEEVELPKDLRCREYPPGYTSSNLRA
jgi:hypothetical protein